MHVHMLKSTSKSKEDTVKKENPGAKKRSGRCVATAGVKMHEVV